jgi:tRNA-specific 2-thiouridylase
MRVLVAMSGGVDSSVAAARLIDDGHRVEGIHLRLAPWPTTDEARDAGAVAHMLGIPFTVEDLTDRFREAVISDFLVEYAAGRTPNPCIRCNERIKFGDLGTYALDRGFDALATGHYARVIPAGPGRPAELHRGVDPDKDQSYVLSGLSGTQLSTVLLPLGSSTKSQVRAEATARGIPVSGKSDSRDICFVPGGTLREWLTERLGDSSGRILDEDDVVLGHHDGCFGYTVGQRRGLNLEVPSPDGQRRYVLEVRPDSGTVVVGPRSALVVDGIRGTGVRWCAPVPSPGAEVGVQIRAHGQEVPAVIDALDGDREIRLRLTRSLAGVAPGQTLAFYRDGRVLGSATISSAHRAYHQ